MHTTTGEDEDKGTTIYPAFKPEPMGLFPTLNNLNSVVDLGLSQLPINTPNALVSLLMVYHNTLLRQLEQTKDQ